MIASARSNSAATMPSPIQTGRYVEMNGIASDQIENGRYESIATVAMCRTTKVPVSIPVNRCTSSSAKRGQCFIRFLPVINRPIETLSVSNT